MPDSESKADKYVKENVVRFLEFYSRFYECKFDFSEESLEGVHEEIESTAEFYTHMGDVGVKDLVLVEVASYLIEMARKKFNGALYWDKTSDQPALLIGLPDFQVHFMPFKKVKYLLEDAPENDNIFLYWKTLNDTVVSARIGDTQYVQ